MKKNKWMLLMAALLMAVGMSAQTPQQGAKQDYSAGNRYFQAKQYAKAFDCYEKAATAGHSGAQYNLGVFYMEGLGTEKDFAKAVEWFEKAASQGEKDAQYNLAVMYQEGVGVEKDPEKANYWAEKFKEEAPKPVQAAPKSASKSSLLEMQSDGEGTEVADVQPVFPGGEQGLMEYLRRNIHYPRVAQENGVQGRVLVQFVVDKDGNVVEPKVVRSVHPALDKEALRVVSAMPKFTPGMQKGEPVRVRFTIPITFRLQISSPAPKSK